MKIAKILEKEFNGNDFEYIFIFDDAHHNSISKDSSIKNANRIFNEIGKPEFIGKFGESVGFAPFSSYNKAIVENRIIENIEL